MDKELECDFFIGDRLPYVIELMHYESLKGYKNRLNYLHIAGNFYWQQGAISLAFKSYKQYILTGEPYCISTWLILLLNRLTGRKSYLWTHGWYGNETRFKILIKKLFFGLADKVLLYGDYARNLMLKEGFKSEKLLTIYNSLDVEEQMQIWQNLKETSVYKEHFKNQFPILLYIGRIQTRKKIELLIEALNELIKNNSPCNLILIGKQTDETNIHKLVSYYGLDRYVWFFGPCYDENILGELIYNADVCVSPGNVGLTAMHALVYGTPVITQNNFTRQMPEFEAISPSLTGDFFTEDSVEDLTKKIMDWVNVGFERRETIRQNCYKIIYEKYNPNKQINVLKEALNLH
ncbi:MAG: glycosyltransferase [Bacteroidota bacterium]|nr:glycosyltransferase [Bacteroidota bacterium]